jgi:hypothetical protein
MQKESEEWKQKWNEIDDDRASSRIYLCKLSKSAPVKTHVHEKQLIRGVTTLSTHLTLYDSILWMTGEIKRTIKLAIHYSL